MRGIGASSGAACASGSTEPSHVLRALGVSRELAQGSLRLTVGIDNTPEDIAYALDVIQSCVAELRNDRRPATEGALIRSLNPTKPPSLPLSEAKGRLGG